MICERKGNLPPDRAIQRQSKRISAGNDRMSVVIAGESEDSKTPPLSPPVSPQAGMRDEWKKGGLSLPMNVLEELFDDPEWVIN